MSRRIGSGKVKVAGKIMTTQMYKDCVCNVLTHVANNFLDVKSIITIGANNLWCEPDIRSKRKATSHPLYRILTYMIDDENSNIERRVNQRGVYEYRLKDPKYISVNNEMYVSSL